jgi:predicted dehydrogenase
MTAFELKTADYYPFPPQEKNYGIGIVGSGGVVRGAHLPAYKKCGYRVLACCDVVEENARLAAEEFDIPHFSSRLEDVLDHPEVEIIDLAVHAKVRPEIIEQIAAHPRKPRAILSQKPFALSLQEARRMVALCEEAGIKLMVNQQARWAPGHRALRHVIESGALGHVYSIMHVARSWQDDPKAWYVAMPNFNIVDHGVHFIDLSRYFSGRTPESVHATAVMVPEQVAVTPMIYTITCQYAPEAQLMSTLHFNNIVQASKHLWRGEWFVDGTEGSAMVAGESLSVSLKNDLDNLQTFKLEGSWWPDAFGGSMGELMQSLTENRLPMCHARDNLESITMALAAVQSSQTGERVFLKAISEA